MKIATLLDCVAEYTSQSFRELWPSFNNDPATEADTRTELLAKLTTDSIDDSRKREWIMDCSIRLVGDGTKFADNGHGTPQTKDRPSTACFKLIPVSLFWTDRHKVGSGCHVQAEGAYGEPVPTGEKSRKLLLTEEAGFGLHLLWLASRNTRTLGGVPA